MASPGAAHSTQANHGAYIKGVTAVPPTRLGAGIGGSGSVVTGETINRCDPQVALSAQLTTAVSATMASGNTLTVRHRIEHNDGSGWAEPSTDVLTQPDDQVVTALNAGGAQVTALRVNVDLSGLKEQVRVKVTATLSASGVDTAAHATVCTLAGYDEVPIE